MNKTEAQNTNVLLDWMLGRPRHDGSQVGLDEAQEAATELAAAANRALMAGVRAGDVIEAWSDLDFPGIHEGRRAERELLAEETPFEREEVAHGLWVALDESNCVIFERRVEPLVYTGQQQEAATDVITLTDVERVRVALRKAHLVQRAIDDQEVLGAYCDEPGHEADDERCEANV